MRLPFLLLCALGLGCGSDVRAPDSPRTIPVETFARVVGDLVVARIATLPDTAAYVARREEVLSNAGVSAEELRQFAAARGADDDVMDAVYRRVEARIDRLSRPGPADSLPGDSLPADPPPGDPAPADSPPGRRR